MDLCNAIMLIGLFFLSLLTGFKTGYSFLTNSRDWGDIFTKCYYNPEGCFIRITVSSESTTVSHTNSSFFPVHTLPQTIWTLQVSCWLTFPVVLVSMNGSLASSRSNIACSFQALLIWYHLQACSVCTLFYHTDSLLRH